MPVHTVSLDSFEITRTEVTVQQYKACVDARACGAPQTNWDSCNWGKVRRESHPMNCVTWNEASAYARWAHARLPSEAEWEYAALGGQSHPYAGSDDIGDVAWYKGNAGARTQEVGRKRANGYGLWDRSGNVWEWVQDWHGPNERDPSTNPTAPAEGARRVLRGGSWFNDAPAARLAYRSHGDPSGGSGTNGFRLARNVS